MEPEPETKPRPQAQRWLSKFERAMAALERENQRYQREMEQARENSDDSRWVWEQIMRRCGRCD